VQGKKPQITNLTHMTFYFKFGLILSTIMEKSLFCREIKKQKQITNFKSMQNRLNPNPHVLD
jgi:hypothetical protein